ncbi:MAG: o-succinylbenzoate synthase [Armatimonadota bacterium]|nr:o-succinylbenzoate synthase [Armatimonadota bacterium]MDR7401626.1 o-succinylbenzoate synthase [Armatimonadota bacterium]MDR7404314.1 o-succinylbenzoate synthase [Armatimonadota bacterium]MDR7436892.1 o-succinylbenzoate synthase [Armatimonadota bacterium]MDR7471568.1 o-succinylbenzoate synthase [Armatimonadota bacterium]
MRIRRVEVREVELPLVFPFQTSFGRQTSHSCLLVRLDDGEQEGWGEVPVERAPLYNEETTGTAWHVLEAFILPLVLSRPLEHPRDFPALVRHLRRHHMAKAGVEAALWDLHCRRGGLPLARALGGVRSAVEAGVSLGIEPTVDALLRRIEEFLGRGYRRIKIKIQPGWDVEVVRRVRKAFGSIPLQVDANSAYTLEQADVFRAMDDFGLLMIEQPLGEDDLVDHAALQARLRTPLCLDESIVSPEHARKALQLGSCRVINIKAARLGGLTAAVATHDLCQTSGIPVWCGGLLETGIGRAANLALASLPNFRLPADLSASDRYYHEDLIDPPVTLAPDGTVPVPSSPGLGVRVRMDRVQAYTVRAATYTA